MKIRIIIILAATILCLGCRETILHNLEELQANRVLVALGDSSIRAEKTVEGTRWNVVVASDQASAALKILEGSRLLYRDLARHTQEPKGLLASKEERTSYLERQQAWNIEQTIETIQGVLEARVHFYIDEVGDGDLIPRARHLSASALIVTNGKQTITEGQVRTIIAGASGTKPEAISVIFSIQSIQKESISAKAEMPNKEVPSAGKNDAGWGDLGKVSGKGNILFIVAILMIIVFVFCLKFVSKRQRCDVNEIPKSEPQVNSDKKNDVKPGTIDIDPLGTMQAYNMNISDLI